MLDVIISLIPGLIITALVYLLVPAIFCLVEYDEGTTYDLKTIKKIVIINGGIIWLICYMIQYYGYGETKINVSPMILWSTVAYWMMKKILLKKDITPKNNDEPENHDEPENDDEIGLDFIDKNKIRKNLLEKDIKAEANVEIENNDKIAFETVDKNTKAESFKTPLIVVSIFLGLSLLLNLYQLGLNNKKSEQERIKLEFLDNRIAFVEDNNSDWYHTYDCYRFSGDEFWALNTELAEDLGYEPCPFCHNDIKFRT